MLSTGGGGEEATQGLMVPLSHLAAFGDLPPAVLEALQAASELVSFQPGETIFRQADAGDALYIVVSGRVQIFVEGGAAARAVADVLAGEYLGEMALLAHQPRSATAVAQSATTLLRVPIDACERVMQASPETKSQLVNIALRRLPSLYLAATPLGEAAGDVLAELDRAATWVRLAAGQTLFRSGDPSDSVFVITHGTLDVLVPDGARERVAAVLRRGALLGEIGVLLGEPRNATLRARRDSELVRIPSEAFQRAIDAQPKIATQLARQLAQRLSEQNRATGDVQRVRTVTLIPLDRSSDVSWLGRALAATLGAKYVAADDLTTGAHLGANDLADSRVRRWLSEQEEQHPFVVYVGDGEASAWTRLVLRQADVVLLVASAGGDPHPAAVERELISSDVKAPLELVLVERQSARVFHFDGTAQWLESRGLTTVHHVRAGSSEDVARVARSIAGTAVGLVLGGGGARGLAHIGVIRAMREAGLSIDYVGGSSMGAIVAALYATGRDPDEMLDLARRHYAEGGGFDLTLPVVALRSAHQTVRTLRALFGDARIEDLATPFFCVSADLTRAEVVVHDYGPLWLAVRASCAIPGLVPPVPNGGNLLVDGGLLNNLPVDVMRRRGLSGPLIAVDVSPKVDLAVAGEGLAEVSGWVQLWARMRPAQQRAALPSIVDILSRAVLLSSVRDSQSRGRLADLCLRPPVDDVPMSAFKSIDHVVECGYRYATEHLDAWLRHGRIERSAVGAAKTLPGVV